MTFLWKEKKRKEKRREEKRKEKKEKKEKKRKEKKKRLNQGSYTSAISSGRFKIKNWPSDLSKKLAGDTIIYLQIR